MQQRAVNRFGSVTHNLLVVVLLLSMASAKAELSFRFAGEFSAPEQAKLETWIRKVHAGVEGLVGAYPFPIVVTFQRSESDQPVPWANTRRGRTQGIRFYVNPSFTLAELLADWTAAHELSHLIFPFVGQRNAWFAEGFASYMQYQVMYSMGVVSADEVRERYLWKLRNAESEFAWQDRRFVDTTPRLRALREYPTMYWGGAVFFFRLNARLASDAQSNLVALAAEYMACCRQDRSGLVDLLADLDAVAQSDLVTEEFQAFIGIVGFPGFDGLEIGVIASD